MQVFFKKHAHSGHSGATLSCSGKKVSKEAGVSCFVTFFVLIVSLIFYRWRWSLQGGTFLFRQESTPRSRLKRGRQRCAPATPAPSPLKNHPHALGENGRMFRIFISHFLPLGADSKMFQILDASHPFVHPEGIPQLFNIHYSLFTGAAITPPGRCASV